MEMLTRPVSAQHEAEEAWSRDPERILHTLEQVLASPPFRHTQQCQNLLRYIVKHTLAGEEHLLRERVIGSEVFGRKPDYETGDDPIVRLRAAEVRKRLAQFYQWVAETPDIHIDIPPGSYRAAFRSTAEHSLLLHPAEPEPHALAPIPAPIETHVPAIHRPRRWIPAATVLVLALIAVIVWALNGGQTSRFEAFWAPWTSSPKPVIIAIGSNAVYRLSDSLNDSYAKEHHLETHGEDFFVPLAPDAVLRGSDLQAAHDSFVALGDVAAVSSVVSALTAQKQSFQERFPNDISFAEIRNSPSLLVGGFNNPMTIELTKNLRFVLRARGEIDDTQDPTRKWLLHASDDSHDTEDYAVVTRLMQRPGDAPILSVAGMGQYGTLAAADFICSPRAISEMAKHLSKDWAGKNLQLVLHVKVVDFKPSATEVVAVHSW